MPRPLIALLLALGVFIAVAASAALLTGLDEARLASGGPRRDLVAEELTPSVRGWLAVFGCVRHDLAVGVTARKEVYEIGKPPVDSDESDRVFTPLAAHGECDESRPPTRIYALVEDDDALSNTLGHTYRARGAVANVAPPPVPALVDGVIGYGAGHARLAGAARAWYGAHGIALGSAPLIAKGRHPGVFWVAVTTAAAGAHGFVLLGLGIFWAVRRHRRALERRADSDEERQFFGQE
jgi:hypothetical protein